jgi:hypothetical protein
VDGAGCETNTESERQASQQPRKEHRGRVQGVRVGGRRVVARFGVWPGLAYRENRLLVRRMRLTASLLVLFGAESACCSCTSLKTCLACPPLQAKYAPPPAAVAPRLLTRRTHLAASRVVTTMTDIRNTHRNTHRKYPSQYRSSTSARIRNTNQSMPSPFPAHFVPVTASRVSQATRTASEILSTWTPTPWAVSGFPPAYKTTQTPASKRAHKYDNETHLAPDHPSNRIRPCLGIEPVAQVRRWDKAPMRDLASTLIDAQDVYSFVQRLALAKDLL